MPGRRRAEAATEALGVSLGVPPRRLRPPVCRKHRICWEFALADFTERYNSKSGSSSRQESTLRQPEWVKSVCS